MNGAVGKDQLNLAIRSQFSAAPPPQPRVGTNRTGVLGKDRVQFSSAAQARLASGVSPRIKTAPLALGRPTFFGEA